MFPEDEMDKVTARRYELLIRYHETQENLDRTTDPVERKNLEERKKEINEQLDTYR